MRLSSGAPFDLGLGFDRNIDDVSNDRPNFSGDLESLRSRERGELLPPEVLASLSLPIIGQVGNLPRNAGRGPGLFIFDITATRNFRISDRVRLRPFIEADNVLNKTVFTFANEFINFNTASATFVNDFLVPTRTLRARQIRVGLRFDF